ncbi:MAG: cell wall-binding repeat-containing protein [Euzebya sp.]
MQVIALAIAVVLGLNQLGLLNRTEVTLKTIRITGADPVSASASVARQSHGHGAPTIIIAGTQALADGVVATGLAGALNAPILLNDSDTLSPQILDLIRELDTQEVVLIGGTNALSEAVSQSLSDLELGVIRAAGPSRFDTANLVADLFEQHTTPAVVQGLRSALIVPAEDVAAGLEAGSLAASRSAPMPVLISQDGALPDPTLDALQRLGIQQLFVVTGQSGLVDGIQQDFSGPVQPIAGPAGAAETAATINPFRPPRVVIVPAGDQARTLIAGPLAGRESGVILTAEEALPWLRANCGTVSELFVIGEPDVITDAQITAAENAASNCES